MINDNTILKACKQFSSSMNAKGEWTKARTNIFVLKLNKTHTGFLSLITRYPKYECKVEEKDGGYLLTFYLLWKFKGIKDLQSQVLKTVNI